jgi:hypothetical protein
MKILRKYRITVVAGALGTTLLAAAFANINVFDVKLPVFERIRQNEVDELVCAALLIAGALCLELFLQRETTKRGAYELACRHEAEIQAQRLRVLKATMRTVEDIVINFLQGLELFRLHGDRSMPAASLAALDDLIDDTVNKIRVLGNLEHTTEKEMAMGTGIDYDIEPSVDLALAGRSASYKVRDAAAKGSILSSAAGLRLY